MDSEDKATLKSIDGTTQRILAAVEKPPDRIASVRTGLGDIVTVFGIVSSLYGFVRFLMDVWR
jgi:hypothetical protein